MSNVVSIVKSQFDSVETFGGNGNYNKTGVPGQYGIKVMSSLTDPDPGFFAPNVTRVFVGGANADVLSDGGLYGQAQGVDIGNFDTSEFVFTVLDEIGNDAQAIPWH